MSADREASLQRYYSRCPVTDKRHDWRYASDAPGWINGDECVRCERCQIKAIAPAMRKEGV